MKTYCPDHIDVILKETFEKKFGATTGFFVDVGANDGITFSNSYLLEQNNWNGILVEPNEAHWEQLKNIRSSKLITYLVSDQDSVEFHVVDGPDHLHGLSRIDATSEFFEKVKDIGGTVKKVSKPAKKLSSILEENDCPDRFDLLSVDVEGHELDVLKTMDFQRYNPTVVVIEDNSKGEDSRVRKFMAQNGYYLFDRVSVNELYCREENLKYFIWRRVKVHYKYFRWRTKRFLYRLVGKKAPNPYV